MLRIIQHHADSLVNIPLAVTVGTIPVWIVFIEDYGWFMTKLIVPTLAAVVALAQLYFLWYKINNPK